MRLRFVAVAVACVWSMAVGSVGCSRRVERDTGCCSDVCRPCLASCDSDKDGRSIAGDTGWRKIPCSHEYCVREACSDCDECHNAAICSVSVAVD